VNQSDRSAAGHVEFKTGGFTADGPVNTPKWLIFGFVHSSENILSHCARTQTKERLLMEGHIKWYDEKKRFGFVTTQENEDIFLHVSGIKEYGHFGLQRDDRVEFEIRETAKGKQAVNLRPAK
jgi:CspA family cold shock protein